MEIKKATEDDLIEILYLTKGFNEILPHKSKLNWCNDFISDVQLSDSIQLGNVYLACDNITLGLIHFESTEQQEHNSILEIKTFVVHPIGIKKETPALLFDFAIETAKKLDIKELHINISTDNQLAISILNKFGFEQQSNKTDQRSILLFSKAISK